MDTPRPARHAVRVLYTLYDRYELTDVRGRPCCLKAQPLTQLVLRGRYSASRAPKTAPECTSSLRKWAAWSSTPPISTCCTALTMPTLDRWRSRMSGWQDTCLVLDSSRSRLLLV